MTRDPARPVRVLVAHPSAELYGSDRVMLESVTALVEDGCQVLVALPGPGPLEAEILARQATVVHCASPVLRKSALRPLGFLRLLRDTVAGSWAGLRLLLRSRPNVVYVSTLTVPLWIFLARLTARRVVCHVHEAEGSAPLILRRVLAAPLLAADRVIANSRFSRDVLASAFAGLGERTEVIYNGVAGPPSVTAARTSLDGPIRLIYLGRLSERKGVDVAVSALAMLIERGRPGVLDVAGAVFPGYEWYERQLRDEVHRLGLADRVRFHGFTAPIWPLVAAADIALVPSRVDEPFGNTAVEAVLAGRPLVVSDTSGLREAASEFGAVTRVPPSDPAAIATAIERIASEWPDYHRQAAQDADDARSRFAPSRYRSEIRATFRTLNT